MNRAKINAVVDILSLLMFAISIVSGIVVWLFLPSGGRFNLFLVLPRNYWNDIHTYSSLLFAFLMAVHFILHLSYYKNLKKIFSD
jgi:hypothetical protein